MRALTGTLAAVASLALAAPAAASLPQSGKWFNGSQARGGYAETTHHSIARLWLFCQRGASQGHPEHGDARYQIPYAIHVRRDGRFSYSGESDRYGPEGEPTGRLHVRLHGRVVSPTKMRMTRTLEGCGTARITIAHE